jgi:hypothetical protein
MVDTYPPVYQMLGTKDWLFEMTQMTEFARELTRRGIDNKAKEVDQGEHGFDTTCEFGDEVDVKWVAPAVEWLCSKCS